MHGLIFFISLLHAIHTQFVMNSLCFVPIIMSSITLQVNTHCGVKGKYLLIALFTSLTLWYCICFDTNDLFALLMLLISLKSCIIHYCVYIVMDWDSNPHIKRESLRYKWDDNGLYGAAGGLIFSLFAESVCLCVCAFENKWYSSLHSVCPCLPATSIWPNETQVQLLFNDLPGRQHR